VGLSITTVRVTVGGGEKYKREEGKNFFMMKIWPQESRRPNSAWEVGGVYFTEKGGRKKKCRLRPVKLGKKRPTTKKYVFKWGAKDRNQTAEMPANNTTNKLLSMPQRQRGPPDNWAMN